MAVAMQASRQPSANCSAEKARSSRAVMGMLASSTFTLHFLHVPCPPQVESIATPFQSAASKTLTPLGTRTDLPAGSKVRLTRAGPVWPGGSA